MLIAIVEFEAVKNSILINLVYFLRDLEELLTPSHLIVGQRLLNLSDHLGCVCSPDDDNFEVNTSQLTKRMKQLVSCKCS